MDRNSKLKVRSVSEAEWSHTLPSGRHWAVATRKQRESSNPVMHAWCGEGYAWYNTTVV
ncbi:uncharacterized protein G2W53_022478 [Senna tora]|uniref:Uncharacterized protein n=1 Tax=Senna tora TaxID=362788 RepID=A0A834TN16_9FABA|nr:uncharacterized protein G2W53_022478 [Senna tora]